MYSVEFSRSARRQLAKLPTNVQSLIVKKLDRLLKHPLSLPDVKKLRGNAEANYRLRVGDYRVLFNLHADHLVILVVKIAHRKEAYRWN